MKGNFHVRFLEGSGLVNSLLPLDRSLLRFREAFVAEKLRQRP
jgi:hypothetical protein